jgi:hypothetical protein
MVHCTCRFGRNPMIAKRRDDVMLSLLKVVDKYN